MMVRESGIAATKPIFPSYLLPTFNLPFRRRSSVSSAASSTATPTSPTWSAWSGWSANSTPSTSPTTPSSAFYDHDATAGLANRSGKRLSRSAPDTLRCMCCASDIGFASQVISKGFTGRHGRAFLVAPSLRNVRVGRSENRQLVTGWHVVADITCGTCATKLGWKYVDAKEASQRYKVGKFILETERVVTHRSWEDVCVSEMQEEDDLPGARNEAKVMGSGRNDGKNEIDEVVFDSEDEDECEDIFAGVWDAEVVAKRRSSTLPKRQTTEA